MRPKYNPMKKSLIILLCTLGIAVLFGECRKAEEKGTIFGSVTDKATGEPIKTAGVELLPVGLKTVTGSDGTFQFTEVDLGNYELFVTKTGYEPTKKSDIQLKGAYAQYDVQIEKLPAALRIVNDDGADISVIDFGSEADDVSRLFNIFNDSESSLSWQITTTANWIISVSETSGILPAGITKGIIVVIDRNKLQQGENITTLHVTSDNGNKQLTIKATRADISTLEATGVTANSAVLHGKINVDIPYSERGFYYGTNHNLNNHITVGGNGTGSYSAQITGLDEYTLYYFKAYCINNGTYLYGEEKQFQYIPSFEYGGHTYWVAPDPHTSVSDYISWTAANDYCNNLTLYGCSDWRMPTVEELESMYLNRMSIGGFINYDGDCMSLYHSSTITYVATIGNLHYYVNWSSGARGTSIYIEDCGKENGPRHAHVRPIRVAN